MQKITFTGSRGLTLAGVVYLRKNFFTKWLTTVLPAIMKILQKRLLHGLKPLPKRNNSIIAIQKLIIVIYN